jgi:hypothetical protein
LRLRRPALRARSRADTVADALREIVGLLRRRAKGMCAEDISSELEFADPQLIARALREGLALEVIVASGTASARTYRARERATG